MSTYQIFTQALAEHFANEHSDLFGSQSKLTTELLKESRQNLVFRVKNQFGRSLIVKQALPYHHAAGPQTPLTVDRARVEAEVLISQRKLAPDQVVEILHFSKEQSAILMEDLHDHQLLNKALLVGRELPGLSEQLAHYLARSSFYTSDFGQSSSSKRAGIAKYLNPELCLITEELAFTDPYCHHERNEVSTALRPQAQRIWLDEQIKTEVAELKLKFTSQPQALIHGDLQCGSIFVTDSSVKVTDAEFACYGPIAFDLGTLIGSFLAIYLSVPAVIPAVSARQQIFLRAEIRQLWQQFAAEFLALAARETRDSALQSDETQQRFVTNIQRDALGFAGIELMRRAIGMETIKELSQVKDANLRLQVEHNMLQLAEKLILGYRQFHHIDQILAQL
jgi:5-methylthioribose kinase